MPNLNRESTQAHDGQVVVGVGKHLQNVPSLPIGGAALTPADLVKLFQSRIDSANTVAAAHANWLATVATHQALNTKVTPILRGLRQYVVNAFGAASPVLADFGFTAPKKRVVTAEQKAAAAVKAKATRAARHTMGKVQKKSVKGAVPGPATATPSAGTAPTVATPAAGAPSQATGSGTPPRTA